MVCIDMDGTLLNSASQITAETAAVLKRCLQLDDVTFLLATGKARPAAIAACSAVGLAGAPWPPPSLPLSHTATGRHSPHSTDALVCLMPVPGVRGRQASVRQVPSSQKGCRAGPGGLVHDGSPGVFIQGLTTYGPTGTLLDGPVLSPHIVQLCFEFAAASGTACLAFLGDTCVATRMDPFIEELHTVYYEPLAQVLSALLH